MDSGKLPAESSHISTAHQKAVKMEIASVCRQWCCNIHPELTWMSRGRGWDLKPMWFWFSLWLKTIYPQDTFLLLREGCEKLKDRVNLALGNTQPRISTVNQQKHLNYQVQFSSVAQSCPTLCDPMNRSVGEDKLDTILKSRDTTLPTKVHVVKAMIFPVVIYECESWTINKAEHQRIAAFKFWSWRRLLTVPWTVRRWNQSVQNEINSEYSLEGLMLKLKLQ